ncbi:MAG TPA: tryptophan--tRNA ligase [Candidatus Limnocylindrales bacterium]|nr:tryptophan--tRNA ligase [Candidatus Limnocylindrales bacterium]
MKTIVSGMRPTGRLHLGNYFGALHNWVQHQHDYRCHFFIADWHALTTDYENSASIDEHCREMLIDWLSAGLDPEKAVMFKQSAVLEHAELFLLLAMITPIAWLERCPTFKEQIKELEGRNINTFGFLGYPLLQAADILAYRADAVPVGEDQAPHLEFTREVVRRFNHLYKPIFPEPQTLLGCHTLVPGIDGRKMSKSYDNYIHMAASPEEIREKSRRMLTDPQRARRSDPGRPEVCTVFHFQKIFNAARVPEIEAGCCSAGIGCVDCKAMLAEKLVEAIAPIYEKRKELENKPQYLREVLEDGNKRAKKAAMVTLETVRDVMCL